ncbi:peptidase C65 Otubain-domain-containing protein [Peziza echinospora]|nr:peptidase C65 Otubain-domain-containing protein [Peziza echinospora]
MNGQSHQTFTTQGYADVAVAPFYIYSELKLQEELAKQQAQAYASPISTPEHYPQDTITHMTPELTPFGAEEQAYSELVGTFPPETTNPLVGDLKSTREIAVEYAAADPVYVAKTTSLYPTYNYYRKIRGDGNCAWRAIAFGYFELLIRSNSGDLIQREWARLTSLENLLKKAGFSQYIYEDFASETFDVFRVISAAVHNNESVTISELVKIFNESSDSIITYFKFLTSAWMRARPVEYLSYLETDTVEDYCSTCIEPFSVELDHVGVKALIDCLILPADFRVEISYLDRSPGPTVNVHHFENADSALLALTLRLLYRPYVYNSDLHTLNITNSESSSGHYDIIYKTGEIRESALPFGKSQSPVQVSFMPQLPEQYFASTPLDYFLNPTGGATAANSDRRNESGDRFRASLFQYPPFQPSPLPFQTSIFRNSAFNPSHYQSENFQPELYEPEVSSSSRSHGHSSSNRRRL